MTNSEGNSSDLPLRRKDEFGWQSRERATDGVEVLCYSVRSDSFNDGLEIAHVVARLATKLDLSDYVQISICAWRVDIIMSVPASTWRSVSQKKFAEKVKQQTAGRTRL